MMNEIKTLLESNITMDTETIDMSSSNHDKRHGSCYPIYLENAVVVLYIRSEIIRKFINVNENLVYYMCKITKMHMETGKPVNSVIIVEMNLLPDASGQIQISYYGDCDFYWCKSIVEGDVKNGRTFLSKMKDLFGHKDVYSHNPPRDSSGCPDHKVQFFLGHYASL